MVVNDFKSIIRENTESIIDSRNNYGMFNSGIDTDVYDHIYYGNNPHNNNFERPYLWSNKIVPEYSLRESMYKSVIKFGSDNSESFVQSTINNNIKSYIKDPTGTLKGNYIVNDLGKAGIDVLKQTLDYSWQDLVYLPLRSVEGSYKLAVHEVQMFGTMNECIQNQYDFLLQNGTFNLLNQLEAKAYCNKNALYDGVPTIMIPNTSGRIVANSLVTWGKELIQPPNYNSLGTFDERMPNILKYGAVTGYVDYPVVVVLGTASSVGRIVYHLPSTVVNSIQDLASTQYNSIMYPAPTESGNSSIPWNPINTIIDENSDKIIESRGEYKFGEVDFSNTSPPRNTFNNPTESGASLDSNKFVSDDDGHINTTFEYFKELNDIHSSEPLWKEFHNEQKIEYNKHHDECIKKYDYEYKTFVNQKRDEFANIEFKNLNEAKLKFDVINNEIVAKRTELIQGVNTELNLHITDMESMIKLIWRKENAIMYQRYVKHNSDNSVTIGDKKLNIEVYTSSNGLGEIDQDYLRNEVYRYALENFKQYADPIIYEKHGKKYDEVKGKTIGTMRDMGIENIPEFGKNDTTPCQHTQIPSDSNYKHEPIDQKRPMVLKPSSDSSEMIQHTSQEIPSEVQTVNEKLSPYIQDNTSESGGLNPSQPINKEQEKLTNNIIDKIEEALTSGNFNSSIENVDRLNSLLEKINMIKGIDDVSSDTKVRLISASIVKTLLESPEVMNSLGSSYPALSNSCQSIIVNGKLDVHCTVVDILQADTGVPLHDVENLVKAIIEDKAIKENLMKLGIDIASMTVPQVRLLVGVITALKMAESITTDISVIKRGAFQYMLAKGLHASLDKNHTHWANANNDLLKIEIHKKGSHFNELKKEIEEEWDKQVKVKAYQVTGIPFRVYEEMSSQEDNTNAKQSDLSFFEKMQKAVFIKYMIKKWETINNLTLEESQKLESRIFESEDDKVRRISYAIQEKHESLFNKYGNLNLPEFYGKFIETYNNELANHKDDIKDGKTNNFTQFIKSLYNIFYETGSEENKKVEFSYLFKGFLHILQINTDDFLEFINHQKQFGDDDLNSQINQVKKNEDEYHTKLLEDKRDNRTEEQNNELHESEKKENSKLDNSEGEYSRLNIIKTQCGQALRQNFTMINYAGCTYSGAFSTGCQTLAYIDKEGKLLISNPFKFIGIKSKQILSSSWQIFISRIISTQGVAVFNSTQISNAITDSARDIICKTISVLSSSGVSTALSLATNSFKNKREGEAVMDIGINTVTVNIKAFSEFAVAALSYPVDFMNYIGIINKPWMANVINYFFQTKAILSAGAFVSNPIVSSVSIILGTRFLKSWAYPISEEKIKVKDVYGNDKVMTRGQYENYTKHFKKLNEFSEKIKECKNNSTQCRNSIDSLKIDQLILIKHMKEKHMLDTHVEMSENPLSAKASDLKYSYLPKETIDEIGPSEYDFINGEFILRKDMNLTGSIGPSEYDFINGEFILRNDMNLTDSIGPSESIQIF